MKRNIILHALGHAILVFLYTSAVAWILFNGEALFGKFKNFLGPVIVLTLFVLSAAIVGTLVLGRPILLYLNGKKSEALRFFVYTLAWLVVIIFVVIILHSLG